MSEERKSDHPSRHADRVRLRLLSPMVACLALILLLALTLSTCRQAPEETLDLMMEMNIQRLFRVEGGPLYIHMQYRWSTAPGFEPPPGENRVFTHFVEGDGAIFFQDDHLPSPPVSHWETSGQVVYERMVVIPYRDPMKIRLPYRLRVGIYDPENPSRKHLLMEQELPVLPAGQSPRVVALEEEIPELPPGRRGASLALTLPAADIYRHGAKEPDQIRYIPGDQVSLIREMVADRPSFMGDGMNRHVPLGIRLPAGMAVEFTARFTPGSRFAFAPDSGGECGFRVLFQRRGGEYRELLNEVVRGEGMARTVQLTGKTGVLGRLRIECTGPEDGIWKFPRIEDDIPPAFKDRAHRIDRRNLRELAKKWNVLLVIQDAARSDAYSCYGNPRRTSPVLDRLSLTSIQFQEAFSNAPYTLSSTVSLLSGLYPHTHGVLRNTDRFSDSLPNLAQAFSDHSFTTAAITASPYLSGAYGTNRGFDYFIESYKTRDFFRAPDVNACLDLLIPRLQERGENRYFTYIHYLEPHEPYDPPPPFLHWFTGGPGPGGVTGNRDTILALDKGNLPKSPEVLDHIRGLYEANLMYADLHLGALLSKFEKAGLLDQTLVIITSDHGEAFNEHGRMSHNTTVHREMIHIPLVLRFPVQDEDLVGLSGQPVDTVDTTAFLYDLFRFNRIEETSRLEGISYLQRLTGSKEPWPKELSLSLTSRPHLFGLHAGHYKLVLGLRGHELYNLKRDPGEQYPSMVDDSLPVKMLVQSFLTQLVLGRPPRTIRDTDAAAETDPTLDPVIRQRLEMLGYME